MGAFRHYFPTLVQQACNMPVHGLHAREQPLPVVFPRPISLVRKRLYFHLRHLGPVLQVPSLSKGPAGMNRTNSSFHFIVGEQIANRKQSCATTWSETCAA